MQYHAVVHMEMNIHEKSSLCRLTVLIDPYCIGMYWAIWSLFPGKTRKICKNHPIPGCSDLVDAVRFGMDYVYAAVSFGRHAVEDAAGRVSPASPVPEAQTLRQMLRAHRR